jgi:hypothetical protein
MKPFIPILLAIVVMGACRSTAVETANPIAAAVTSPTEAMRLSAADTDAAEPAIAADKAGNTFVVFVEYRPDKSSDIFIRTFDAQLKPLVNKVRVNPEPGEAKSWYGDTPSVTVGPEGQIFVGWNRKAKTGRGNDLMVSASRDGGLSFEPPVKVNDDVEPASHGMHSLAIGKDGRLLVAWLDERNITTVGHVSGGSHEMAEPNSEVYIASSTDGGKSFSANQKVASEVCPCCRTAIAIAPDGDVYLSWRQVLKGELRHMAVASSTDAGATFSEPSIVSDDQWELYACPVSGAALLAEANKKLKVMWYTAGRAGQAGVYSAESTDGGKTFSNRTLVSGDGISGTPWIGDGAQIFAVADGKVLIRASGQPDRTIEGEVPVVALTNGKPLLALVRKVGNERSVWITR